MLSHAVNVYGSDLKDMAATVTKIMFLKKLVITFESTWGCMRQRIVDYTMEYCRQENDEKIYMP